MFLCKTDNRCATLLTLLISAFAGIVAGYLYLDHFLYGRILFWIALGVAAAMWLLLLITGHSGLGEAGRHRRSGWPQGLAFADLALFTVSTVALLLADAHTVLHAVLFGLTVALLGFVLITSLRSQCPHAHAEENGD